MELDELQLRELGLARQPFDEDTSLQDPDIEARVGTILQLLQTGNRIVLVTGPIGVGVSQLLQDVEHNAGGVLRFLSLDGEDRLMPDDIAHACLEAFDLPPAPVASGPRLMGYVTDRLEALVQAGERPTLIVDNAHNLSPDTMAALLQLQGFSPDEDPRSGPSLLLAGAPDVEEALRETLRDNDRAWVFHLEPWTVDQVAAYIDLGLERAGAMDDQAASLLDPEEIHAASGGYPAQVRAACIQALAAPRRRGRAGRRKAGSPLSALPQFSLSGFRLPQGMTATSLLSRRNGVIAAATVVVLALLLVLMLPSREDALPEEELVVPPRPASVETERAQREPEQDRDVPELVVGDGGQPDQPTDDDVLAGDSTVPESEPDTVPIPDLTEQRPEESVAETEPEPEQLVERPHVQAEQEARPQEAEQPSAGETADAAAPATGGDAWLESRRPGNYTIQLVAAYNPQTLAEFASSQANSLETQIVMTRRDGRDWYVVVSGDYADREQAREVLETLPAELRQQGAWVRTFESLLRSRE